jgi:hypothetical protein
MPPLESAWHKTERAKKHILDLQRALQAFLDTRPYEVVREHKADTGEYIYRVARIAPTPPDIMLIAGDAIHNLRSALDYTVWEVAEIHSRTHPKLGGYPIFKDLQTYETEKARRIEGVDPISEKLIDGTKPYKGGNDLFWTLHELDNIDKHRVLVGTFWQLKNVDFLPPDIRAFGGGDYAFTNKPGVLEAVNGPRNLKAGDILLATKVQLSDKVDFGLTVAFNEPPVVEGQAVVELVETFARLVDQTIRPFYALLSSRGQ